MAVLPGGRVAFVGIVFVDSLVVFPSQTVVPPTVTFCSFNVLSNPVLWPLSEFQVTVISLSMSVKPYGLPLLMVMVMTLPERVIPLGAVIPLQLGTAVAIGVGVSVRVGVIVIVGEEVMVGLAVIVGDTVGVGVPARTV